MNFKDKVRTIQDFPIPGMRFHDITTLLKDPESYHAMVDSMLAKLDGTKVDLIAGPEARGFLLGAPMAYQLHAGFAPLRRPGKLPAPVYRLDYSMEQGVRDTLEIHRDAVQPGQRVVVVDDLLATGHTALAACQLVESMGGIVVAVCFAMEFTHLAGRETLKNYTVHSVIKY
jgi:adenine phosphoribosyltransferase